MAGMTRTMPLGIDIGTTRVRIAQITHDEDALLLQNVMTINLDAKTHDERHIGARIAQTLEEYKIRERRCILAVGEPDALLRTVVFPPMSARERERAARFEAMRHIDYPPEDAFVRSLPIPQTQHAHALGIVRRAKRDRLLGITRIAGLRAIALDHEAYALQRAFPYADAVLDMGHATARLYAFGKGLAPLGVPLETGARMFTQAICHALGIDADTAEHRKRTIGLSGAGEAEMKAFAMSVGRALLTAHHHGMPEIHRFIVTGNGARLHGLGERLERDTGCSVDIATHLNIERSAYPADITRAAAPDWALCVGLALWSTKEKP